MVVVDDYSRYTWVMLPREKSKACGKDKALFNRIQNEKGYLINRESEVIM